VSFRKEERMSERISSKKERSRKAAENTEKQTPQDMTAPNAERKGVKKSVTPLPKRFSHSALGSR
jgi:hypothetical protein